ncbi:MAG: translation elongation factor 4 [Acidimicrobiales bacterium]|jgi:GTP-binding protein LepA|nr:elongation factor 4 [Acidimicrobiaceae bacterium]MDP6161951.1 translation elongation factor 4 [Acidimicrobiales bacterium]MDP6285733.1 translation elongation factor 4 [Acidimicrobiales bacterium]HJL91397.1 translation elongation factor 4 [Acidimicrobiales bacterium]HJO40201.1 translation elongation factor 4 [Acidimicrobiales bacterium]
MTNKKMCNTSIIAHIDHGKSTLADRMLELCGAVDERNMRAQYLDSMDLERERGITIKLQSVRLDWKDSVINLIDTPGHVDFGYEVSRSLAACEGVILVVDAAQGIEAQTLANCYQALEHDLEIVAVLNKIDLPAAEPDRYAEEIEKALGIPTDEIFRISAKTGEGVSELLDAVVEKTPSPEANEELPLQALVFDSHFDQYRGVVSSVRIMQGRLDAGMSIKFMQAGTNHQLDEVGVWRPEMTPVKSLGAGEVGYVLAGIKDVGEARSGETITTTNGGSQSALSGYQEPKPMVFSGLYPMDGDDFGDLRDALEKLRLNDSSFTFEPDTSSALGFGFRCGFLGLLHMEIVRERLEREFDLNLITTAPSVKYRVIHVNGKVEEIDNPCDLPSAGEISAIEEPWLSTTLISPAEYTGTLMELCQGRRGELDKLSYLSPERIELKYQLPLAEVVLNFFDQLKSRTQGYASLDYEPAGYMKSDLVRVDILLQGESVDAFSAVVHRDASYEYGRKMAEKLKELIPRQQFEVPIQATIGGRIIARETVRAYRKDVTAKLYGGDITRKRKLLEKQKQGKRKMKSIGRVDVPQEAFVSALSLEE